MPAPDLVDDDDDDSVDDDDSTEPDDDDSAGDDDDTTPGDDDDTTPPEVWPPDAALFRSANETFNTRWYAVLVDGLIYVKPNVETGGEPGDWQLLGTTGMPEGANLPNFGPPIEIVAISGDGVHLQALDDLGRFYRGTNMTEDILGYFEWTDQWGGVGAGGDGLTQEFSTEFGWSTADSHPFGVDHYEDINGTVHSVGLGVAHLYRLGPQGRRIYFNDWWLPNDWSRQICGPDRGTFTAANISASASTMFVIGAGGAMYTRLYDFDTGGENSLLTYSYIVPPQSGEVRRLPSEDWLRQPDVESGLITSKITIFQNGQGNAARTLRVEGTQGGTPGYFQKEIFDDAWTFVPTQRQVNGPFLNDPEATPPPTILPADQALSGALALDGQSLQIELLDFNVVCSPAQAVLSHQGQPVTVGGVPLVLELHHVHTMVMEQRPESFWLTGMGAEVQAALLVPGAIDQIDDAGARAAVQGLFGDREVVNFLGQVTPESVELSEIMWTTPFRVPGDEKAFWSPTTMSLQ